MHIRRFELSDAFEVSSLIRRAVVTRDNRNYTLAQIYSFANHCSVETIISELDKKLTFVCVDDGKIVGTATLKGDEISTVFILPEYQGKGLGKKFMKMLENEAVSKGLSKVKLFAVLSAVSFYEMLGYKSVSEEFHCEWGKGIVMEKALAN